MTTKYILGSDAQQRKFVSDARKAVYAAGIDDSTPCFWDTINIIAEIRANDKGFTFDIDKATYPK